MIAIILNGYAVPVPRENDHDEVETDTTYFPQVAHGISA
jgi:hypothetical protein